MFLELCNNGLIKTEIYILLANIYVYFMYTECCHFFTVVRVQFSQISFTGTEASGFVLVSIVLDGGSSANLFSVTITPSEQSPVSAAGGE